jgi:sugar phosphate isomerase/epimerase
MRYGILADLVRNPAGAWDVRLGQGSVVEQLPRFRELGLGFMEVFAGQGLSEPGGAPYLEEFARQAAGNGVVLYSVHTPFDRDISVVDAEARETALAGVRTAIEAAGRAGAKFVVVHPGGLVTEEEKPARLDRSVESLAMLNEYCRASGVRMAVENMPSGVLGGGSAEFAGIMARLAPDAGVCLDTGHAFITNHSPVKVLDAIRERLLTLHVHDNDGKQDLHQIPGEGGIAWREFIDVLVARDFKGVFMLELGHARTTTELLSAGAEFCRANLPK